MKAWVYNGPREVAVRNVPDARLEWLTGALMRIVATDIRGSDLHMYEGCSDMEPGRAFRHENLGREIGLGPAVSYLKKGGRVCLGTKSVLKPGA